MEMSHVHAKLRIDSQTAQSSEGYWWARFYLPLEAQLGFEC
jgi:hypothetical protein